MSNYPDNNRTLPESKECGYSDDVARYERVMVKIKEALKDERFYFTDLCGDGVAQDLGGWLYEYLEIQECERRAE